MSLQQEQELEEQAAFDINLTDDELINLVRVPFEKSQKYWEGEFGLKKVREGNMNLWLPAHQKGQTVYDYQEGNVYQDPRIFVSTETINAVVNSRIPQPGVVPASDSITSVALAEDVGKAMFAHSEKYRTNDIFRMATRNLQLKRDAYIKLRFDPTVGKYGEIVPELVLPEMMTVDMHARWGETPRFMAQEIDNMSFEELIANFPESEQTLLELAGVKRKDKKGNLVAYKSQLAKKPVVYEVWIQYLEDGKRKSATAVFNKDFNVVISKMRNPNWNYDDEDEYLGNILENPIPPYVHFNYLNDGSSYIDVTSMIEQAATLQKILDRRGFQIMDNADQAGSGRVFNTNMIQKEDIARLTGAPDESIGVAGDVRAAVGRMAPPPLPNYVLEDKLDARMEIDDIFGTHDISRGKQSGNQTLGQDRLQVNQDYTRMDDISRAIMRAAVEYYRQLAQMMKVYYTEEHWMMYKGEDGKFASVMMKQDLIEDGIDIQVEEGSNLPINKSQQQELVANLAQAGMIDPLTMYEVGSGMPMPSPKKMVERLLKWQTDPMTYAGIATKEESDRYAMKDIEILNRGFMPELRTEVSADYLNTFNKYMASPDYLKARQRNPKIEELYIAHLQSAQGVANQMMQLLQTQMPTQVELDQQAMKESQMNQITQNTPQGGNQNEEQSGGINEPPSSKKTPPPPNA